MSILSSETKQLTPAQKFAAILARVKATRDASLQTQIIDSLTKEVANENPEIIDYTLLGLSERDIDNVSDDALSVFSDIVDGLSNTSNLHGLNNRLVENTKIGVARDDITLNSKQQLFNDTVLSGESCCLLGAAGTGKTTSVRTVSRNLIAEAKLPKLTIATKHLAVGSYGVAIVSYTRKAVNNIRHAVVNELKPNVLTLHKLLEFAPVYYTIEDPISGLAKNTMRFEPQRNAFNPLPSELSLIIFEESSMIAAELYELFKQAMPHPYKEVFLGDIQQLPPIFGAAILGFKMQEHPCIELTEVYRQALESPILSLAWKIINGDPEVFHPAKTIVKEAHPETGKVMGRIKIPSLENLSYQKDGSEVKFQIWQKKLDVDSAINVMGMQFASWNKSKYYNPQQDIILMPYNKKETFGATELNAKIMDFLSRERGAVVHEIISGFNTYYYAIGDRVLHDKEDAFITSIRTNGEYMGKQPQPASIHLDRWGHYQHPLTEQELIEAQINSFEMSEEQIESFILKAASYDSEERVQAASHVICIRYAYQDDSDAEIVLSSASEINNLLGGHVLTTHKFQGSESERIFLIINHTHARMVSREFLYTSVTRAKKFLHILCEADTFYKGVQSQRIKGNTLSEKLEYFKGRYKKEDQGEC